jgi:hypothetical protein
MTAYVRATLKLRVFGLEHVPLRAVTPPTPGQLAAAAVLGGDADPNALYRCAEAAQAMP